MLDKLRKAIVDKKTITDKINIAEKTIEALTEDEINNLRNNIKSPNICYPGDPDITIWNACKNELFAREDARNPYEYSGIGAIDIVDLIPFLNK